MPLPEPSARRHLHTRTIKCEGYERDDGLVDIEAQIIDQKTYAVDEPIRGHRPAGAHVHDMQVRLTLDATMTVRAIAVATNHAPYDICPSVAPGYQKPAGASAAKPLFIDGCKAWAADGPVVQKLFPMHYRG